MTACTTLNEKVTFNAEDETILSYCNTISYATIKQEESLKDIKKILLQASISLKTLANAYYKETPNLEPNDIDYIKLALNNYKSDNDVINKFKTSLIEDLSDFQSKIRTNYSTRLAEVAKEKQICERKIKVLDFEKHKLIMERLSKVSWPYDAKTKEYDKQIVSLQNKIQKCEQQLLTLQKSKPMANEKDILIYQMHLKERFAK